MKRFLLALLICLAILAGRVQAQDSPNLSRLEISLWPEFDQPDVLVIYRGQFDMGLAQPIPVEIRIPSRVGQPTAVAYVSEDGGRFNQEYTTRIDGDWLVVSFDLSTTAFQLEYYDALPVDAVGQRTFTYAYPADYTVEVLSLDLQVPPTARDFSVSPEADSVAQESDALVYHLFDIGPVDQGEELSWTFSYQKDNTDLTVSALTQPGTPAPTPAPAAQSSSNTTVLLFLVAFVGLIAVGAGSFWLGRRTQPLSEQEPSSPSRPKRRGSGRGGRPSPPDHNGTLFCYACGTTLRSDSEYCHKCGTRVRQG